MPAMNWQDWSHKPHSFDISEGYVPAQRHTSQSTASSDHSEDLGLDVQQPFQMHSADFNDFGLLGSMNATSPRPAYDATFAGGDGGKRETLTKDSETSGLEHRRAKNRTAASKCRAKQRSQTKALQKAFDEFSSKNASLKRQARDLRGLVASLRDCVLQHDSTRCRCTSLHAFNEKRAERIFREMEP